MGQPLILFLVNILILLWIPCETQYVKGTNSKIVFKILLMAKEVVIDALSKIASVQHFQDTWHRNTAFQMGNIVYRIRAKYKRMVFLFQLVLERIEKKIKDSNINELSEMDALVHEIDNLIRMIEMWEENREESSNIHMALLRSYSEAKIWQALAESDHKDQDQDQGSPTDVENNTGRRKNRKWHYSVQDNSHK